MIWTYGGTSKCTWGAAHDTGIPLHYGQGIWLVTANVCSFSVVQALACNQAGAFNVS